MIREKLQQGLSNKAILFVVLFFLFLFFVPIDISKNRNLWGSILDASHLPLGALVYLFSHYLLVTKPSKKAHFLFPLVVSLLIVSLVELIQPYFGRSASETDMIIGSLGVLLAAAFFEFFCRSKKGLLFFIIPVFFISVVYSLWPVYLEFSLFNWRELRFPVLSDFSNQKDLYLWKTYNGAESELVDGRLMVKTAGGRYSGILYGLENSDWTEYNKLSFDIFSNQAFPLGIRIDDSGKTQKYNMRFNKRLQLVEGLNKIEIPLSKLVEAVQLREFKLNEIRRVFFFSGKDQSDREFYLDNVRLER